MGHCERARENRLKFSDWVGIPLEMEGDGGYYRQVMVE